MGRKMGEFGVALTVTGVALVLAATGLAGRLGGLLVWATGLVP
jgi:hypothetical protein